MRSVQTDFEMAIQPTTAAEFETYEEHVANEFTIPVAAVEVYSYQHDFSAVSELDGTTYISGTIDHNKL